MSVIRSLCVFCGSSTGDDPAYAQAARDVAAACADRGIAIVYGGGSVGLMGILADEALARGVYVTGVIPQPLWDREVGHRGLSDLRIVSGMHERKALMAELSDGFLALTGGIGTMEEFFEVWTWGLLGVHAKPCGLLNTAGYYSDLLAFLDNMTAHGLLRGEYRRMVLVDDHATRLLDQFAKYQSPSVAKWIDRDRT